MLSLPDTDRFALRRGPRHGGGSGLRGAQAARQSRVLRNTLPALAGAFFAGPALAHDPAHAVDAWTVSLAALLAIALALYALGLRRLWSARLGAGIARRQASYFFLGMAVLTVALLPPLDTVAERSFAAHMLQHELLMLVAAPLLVLARPLAPYLHALPPGWRRPWARWLHRGWLAQAAAWLTRPLVAWTVHAAALWLWHAPLAFNAALAHTGVHVAQHASFFAAAVIYWWSVLPGRTEAAPGVGVLSLFATTLHGNVLGALLTFAPASFYAYHGAYGLTALEDQQLGGLIMWVPAGAVYVCAGLLLFARLLRPSQEPSHHAR